MPDINYMGAPTSFLPDAAKTWQQGPMGGIQYNNQMDDYNRIMGVQHFLQQLGAQRAQQEQGEFEAGAPIRQLERDAKGETLQGQMPFLRQQAGEKAQTDIAGQQFKRQTDYSPDAQKDFFRQLRQKATDDQWKNYQAELTAGANLANEALEIEKTQGPQVAMQHVQQKVQELQSKGIQLPAYFADATKWKSIRDAGVQSIGHMQEMEKTNAEIKGRLDVAKEHSRGAIGAASARANVEAKLSPEQLLVRLQTKVFSGDATPEEVQQYSAQVSRKWDEQLTKNPVLQQLQFQANSPDNTTKKKTSQANLQSAKDVFMAQWGLKPTDAPKPKPADKKAGPVKFGDMPKAQ